MSDQELKDEVAKIVASCDLAQMTKRVWGKKKEKKKKNRKKIFFSHFSFLLQSVLAALTSKFGESALAGKVDMVKSAIVEEVAKREEQSAGKEEEQREEQRDAKAEKTAPKKRAKAPEKSSKAAAAAPAKKKKKDEEADVENPLDALPTNVEAEVDLTSFLRRNPGRTGRVVTKAKPVKKAKKERDPNKPKKPGLPLHLSTPMAEFMGTKISTRTEVTAKIRALIKEKNLQVNLFVFFFFLFLSLKIAQKQKQKRIQRMEEIFCCTTTLRWQSSGRQIRRFNFCFFFFCFFFHALFCCRRRILSLPS